MDADNPATLHRRNTSLLQAAMQHQGWESCFLSELTLIRWLSGFSGSSARILLTPQGGRLYTDFRYRDQAASEVHGMETIITNDGFIDALRSDPAHIGATMAVQAAHLTWQEATRLQAILPLHSRMVAADETTEGIRMVKTGLEITRMRRAVAISEAVLAEILPLINDRVTERDIAAEISYRHLRHGADGDSFAPIVASGVRSAMPHARPTDARFRTGEPIVIDFGCTIDGYASDQTRTVVLGRAPEPFRTIYAIVRQAQESAIAAARSGMPASDLDAIARQQIAQQGYATYFGHGLGHGIGLDVHELPRISSRSSHKLQPGMLFTIEPGIYLPDRYGVRIEDTVLLTSEGATPLQQWTKELLEL